MKKLNLLLLGVLSTNVLFSQVLFPEVISCFGGHSQNETIQLTWTAGEPLYETISNNSNIMTQGFNQVVYITDFTEIKEAEAYSINIYPNPSAQFINIKIESEINKNLRVQLFDIEGRLLISQQIMNNTKQIDISHLEPSVYTLNFLDSKQIIKAFKINKVQ